MALHYDTQRKQRRTRLQLGAFSHLRLFSGASFLSNLKYVGAPCGDF